MNRRIFTHCDALAMALDVAGFKRNCESPLRNMRQLVRECRDLGGEYAADQIAADCADALEKLAARFRGAARKLGSAA